MDVAAPVLDAQTLTTAKHQLRLQLREQNPQYTPAVRKQHSEQIIEHLFGLTCWQTVQGMHGYLSMPVEVDTASLFERCAKQGILTFAPIKRPHTRFLDWAPWQLGQPVAHMTKAHIPQPQAPAQPLPKWPCTPPWNIMCVPCVAFDEKGRRLGHGMGCYDWLLAQLHQMRAVGTLHVIGLAFQYQIVPEVPVGATDAEMDCVITENGVIWSKKQM